MRTEPLTEMIRALHCCEDQQGREDAIGRFLVQQGVRSAFFVPEEERAPRAIVGDLPNPACITDLMQKTKESVQENDICVQTGDERYMTITVNSGNRLAGWLFISPQDHLPSDLKDLMVIEFGAGILQTKREESLAKKTTQLATIRMLSEKISGVFELNDLLSIVTEYVTKALGAKGTVIRLVNKESGLLDIMSEFGLADIDIRRFGINPGSGVSGKVWKTKQPKLVRPDTPESVELLESKLKVRSMICVPLIFEDEVIGTMNVYEKITGLTFEEEDQTFLEVIASLVAPLIAYAAALSREKKLYVKLRKNLDDMELIAEINKVIMQPQKLDELLHIILTALTFGEEIGFNRAALFMYNSQTGTIQGMIGIGCESHDEARKAWEGLPKNIPAVEWIEKLSRTGDFSGSLFNEKVKGTRFNINEVPNIVDALKFGKVYVAGVHDDYLKREFGVHQYAIVPLIGREDVLGMLYVDNKFTHRTIDEDYTLLLSAFASQAVLAIENSKLYSELKDTNDMLKMARQELLIKEKLAIVGEMLTTLAHEIRNPLTAIGGFSNIMIKKIQDPVLKELAEKISGQASKMDTMFREFLYLAKHSSFVYNYADINSLVRNCVEIFSYNAKPGLTISLETSEILPQVYIDKNTIEVVLNNLIKNAIQALQNRGHIFVRTFTDNDFVCFSVEDSGPGIPSHVLPHIFDPFYTTKFDGVGIGLSISYKIVKQHEGVIYAENKKDGGARFIVKLPVEKKSTKGDGHERQKESVGG